MIEILKIKLLDGMYAKEQWECVLEIPDNCSLDDLHLTILSIVNFDNDHMYEFRLGRTYFSRNNTCFLSDEESVDSTSINDILTQLKGKKLFYMFDYGDSWLFQISKSRKKAFEAKPDTTYPRIVSETGVRPEQYPDWDDE